MVATAHHEKIKRYAEDIRDLIETALDSTRNQQEAADMLNSTGVTTYNGKPWTVYNLRHFRKTYLAD